MCFMLLNSTKHSSKTFPNIFINFQNFRRFYHKLRQFLFDHSLNVCSGNFSRNSCNYFFENFMRNFIRNFIEKSARNLFYIRTLMSIILGIIPEIDLIIPAAISIGISPAYISRNIQKLRIIHRIFSAFPPENITGMFLAIPPTVSSGILPALHLYKSPTMI